MTTRDTMIINQNTDEEVAKISADSQNILEKMDGNSTPQAIRVVVDKTNKTSATVLSITGKGKFCGVMDFGKLASNSKRGLKITVDGEVIFNAEVGNTSSRKALSNFIVAKYADISHDSNYSYFFDEESGSSYTGFGAAGVILNCGFSSEKQSESSDEGSSNDYGIHRAQTYLTEYISFNESLVITKSADSTAVSAGFSKTTVAYSLEE